jgi:hypothetical protein
MNNKLLIGAVALIFIIGGLFFIGNKDNSIPEEEMGKKNIPTPEPGIIGSSGMLYVYTVDGSLNGGGTVTLDFTADGGYPILNVALDYNGDGTYNAYESEDVLQEKWAARNARSYVTAETKNNFVVDISDPSIIASASIRGVATFSDRELLEDWWNDASIEKQTIELSVETYELSTILGLNVPGGGPGVYRGFADGFSLGTPFAYAQPSVPDLDVDLEYEIPDIRQESMECAPTSITNNMIGLAKANGRDGDLPPAEEMIEELKEDLQFGDEGKAGVLDKNYIAGKNAFMRRYNLPVITTEIQNPSFDDIADALANGSVVEMDLAFIDAANGNAHTASHVVTVTGLSSDGGDFTLRGRDSATPDGHESWQFFPRYDGQPSSQMHYPLWKSATVINKIYVQTYVSVDEAIAAGVLPEGAVGSTYPVDVLVIGGNYYPKQQFAIGSNPNDECKAQHWHKHTTAYGLRAKTGTDIASTNDPAPDNCGFGKVGEVPEETIRVTWDQQQALAGALSTP